MAGTKAKHKGGLPARWRRGRIMAALFTVVVAAVVAYVLLPYSQADQLDLWLLQARFWLRERIKPTAKSDPDIIIVRMEDHCAKMWPEPFIAWGPHLATAIDRLTVSGAKVIGLDWTQPNTVEPWFPGNDEKLMQSLLRSDRVIWIKNVVPDSSQREFVLPFAGLLYAQPSANLDLESVIGYSEFVPGESLATSMYPVVPGNPSDASFAVRIVERALGAKGRVRSSHWEIPGKASVTLRDNGTLLINYATGTGKGDFLQDNQSATPFEHYSLYDVASLPDRPDPRFKDKIVLIGVAFTGSNDQHYVPFLKGLTRSRLAFGTDIQANVVRTLLRGLAIKEPKHSSVWWLGMALSMIGLYVFLRLPWLSASIVTLEAGLIWIGLSFVLFSYWDVVLPIIAPLTSLVVSGGVMGGYLAFSEGRERRQVMKLWRQYQNPRIVEYLLINQDARGGQGVETHVTVLFADLQNFTKTVESLPPGEALRVLNRYLAMMETMINKHNGIVDKFLGDGLMAQWGAPEVPDQEMPPDHAEAAVRACLEIEAQAKELQAEESKEISFGLRLTLHTGPIVLGWVGTSNRLEFTIIGDTVNVTARLQETAKQLNCEFLVSETTYERVKGWVVTGKQAEVEIRGRKQPLHVYEIVHSKNAPVQVK